VPRSQYGDYFGIGVAGYPEAHPDYIVDDEEAMKKNYWDSLDYLKQKVGAEWGVFWGARGGGGRG
jgi:methylenetetrahydrofolate reductase (NADPH)